MPSSTLAVRKSLLLRPKAQPTPRQAKDRSCKCFLLSIAMPCATPLPTCHRDDACSHRLGSILLVARGLSMLVDGVLGLCAVCGLRTRNPPLLRHRCWGSWMSCSCRTGRSDRIHRYRGPRRAIWSVAEPQKWRPGMDAMRKVVQIVGTDQRPPRPRRARRHQLELVQRTPRDHCFRNPLGVHGTRREQHRESRRTPEPKHLWDRVIGSDQR